MDKSTIMEQFAALAGLDISEVWRYSPVADAAIRQVEQSRRRTEEENVGALEYLCAAVCYYHFTLLETGGEDSIRAADISVVKKKGDRSARAKQIRDDAFLQAKDFLRDNQFFFGRSEG